MNPSFFFDPGLLVGGSFGDEGSDVISTKESEFIIDTDVAAPPSISFFSLDLVLKIFPNFFPSFFLDFFGTAAGEGG
jgi:hypothetical protein